MSSLATTYANALGLPLNEMYVRKQFYPLDFQNYITIQPFSSNQNSKNYDYWNEVLSTLSPLLNSYGIKIVQIGAKDEPPLNGCFHTMGKTSFPQASYLISNALLHFGADSFGQHVAGACEIPLVVIFGSTNPDCHGAKWKKDYIFIESHRFGRNPSFGNEGEKTVNLIPPEEIINSILSLLKINVKINSKSTYIGQKYNQTVIEWIPDANLGPEFMQGAPVIARLDWGGNEEILLKALSVRKLNLYVNSDIDVDKLTQFKENIEQVIIEFNNQNLVSIDFIRKLKSLGAKITSISYDLEGDKLSEKRFEFFDHCQIVKIKNKTITDFENDTRRYLNDNSYTFNENKKNVFKTNKIILSQGKFYLSKYNLSNNLPTSDLNRNFSNVVNDNEFWKEQEHFYFIQE